MRPVAGFLGKFFVKLDEKHRIILPAKIRAGLVGGAYLTTGQDKCLFLFSETQLDQHLDHLKGRRPGAMPSVAFMRMFNYSVTPQTPDKQGRIHIAPDLREHAGLERELVILGMGERLEIWDVTTWQAYMDTYKEAYTQGAEMLDNAPAP